MATLYTFLFLQKALEEAKCRSTRTYLNILEQSGIIPKPRHTLMHRSIPTKGTMTARIYEKDEIKTIVKIIKAL